MPCPCDVDELCAGLALAQAVRAEVTPESEPAAVSVETTHPAD
jgi:hypothetical protein